MKEADKLADKCMFLNVLLETRSSTILSSYDWFLTVCCASLDWCHSYTDDSLHVDEFVQCSLRDVVC